MSRPPDSTRSLAVTIVFAMVIPAVATAQTAATYFEENCTACHTIGEGELNGPDLKGVTETRDAAWLKRFITNPEAMVNAGDATAVALVHKYDDAVMPTPENLTPALVDDLIRYLAQQSGNAPPSAAEIEETPFTAEDVAAGAAIFSGRQRLASGGAACVSCHGAGQQSGLGGGRLGPDLTGFYQRVQGRRGATAWLHAPPMPVMRGLFADRPLSEGEVRALTAFLASASTSAPPVPRRIVPAFLLSGMFGALIGLVLFDRTWKGRLGRRGHR